MSDIVSPIVRQEHSHASIPESADEAAQEETYLGNIGFMTLLETVAHLTPDCNNCGGRNLRICVEKYCAKEPVFCVDCQNHLMHDTNDLKMLFMNKNSYADGQRLEKSISIYADLLESEVGLMNSMKDFCELLIGIFQDKIQAVRQLIELNKQETWHTLLCQDLEDYTSGRTTSREAREAFKQHLKSVNLKPKSFLYHLSAFSQGSSISTLSSLSKTFCDIVKALEGHQSLINQELEKTIESRMKEFAIEKFPRYFNDTLATSTSKLLACPGRSLTISDRHVSSIEFEGSRLIAQISDSIQLPVKMAPLSSLRELHTNAELCQNANPRLNFLDIGIRQESSDKLKAIPTQVKTLMLYSNNNRGCTQADTHAASSAIERITQMPELRQLYLAFPAVTANDLRRLVAYINENNITRGCLRSSEEQEGWTPWFPRRMRKRRPVVISDSAALENLESIQGMLSEVELINQEYQQQLQRMAAIVKRPYLRNFGMVQDILDACSASQKFNEPIEHEDD